ncbi:hypothetical protein [Bradyrhizobium sp. LHD-71]|uniref:hypothetical protein n=1 Tax=Bradyrhizobium sp. LHD-71 TaxID=3072141 RepID=UPI0035BE1E34
MADAGRDSGDLRTDQEQGAGDLVWKFTTAGEFEFGCLIPDHREAGMIGTIIDK